MTERIHRDLGSRHVPLSPVGDDGVWGGMTDMRGSHASSVEAGSLIVRRDGTIVTAERLASSLLHAPDPDGLAGRDWTSLISQGDAGTVPAVRRALAGGREWQGTLRYRYGYEEVVLKTAILPVGHSDDLS